MDNKINLLVPEPCHEDWNRMAPSEKGRSCSSCNKTVIDFTNFSDDELLQFFSQPGGSVCGRLRPQQLKQGALPASGRNAWYGYLLHFIWPAALLLLKSCGQKTYTGKDKLTGEVQVSKKKTTVIPTGVLGFVIPEITPVTDTPGGVNKSERRSVRVRKEQEALGDTSLQLKEEQSKDTGKIKGF